MLKVILDMLTPKKPGCIVLAGILVAALAVWLACVTKPGGAW